MGMGRNGRTDLLRGSIERSPPLSRTVFSLGYPLTGHNWAALLLIDRTPFRRLLILALLLISGNVHPNPGPISNHPHPRYPCSICHLDCNCNYILFTKLPWPGDSERTFWSSSQATTCPPVYHTRWM